MSSPGTEYRAQAARPTETKGEARTSASWGRAPSPSRYARLARLLFEPEQGAAPDRDGGTSRGGGSRTAVARPERGASGTDCMEPLGTIQQNISG